MILLANELSVGAPPAFAEGFGRQPSRFQSGSANRSGVFAAKVGGARRDRTDDLLLAKQALSQLSYGPVKGRRTDDR